MVKVGNAKPEVVFYYFGLARRLPVMNRYGYGYWYT